MKESTDIINVAFQKLTEYIEQHQMRKTPERYEILKIVCQSDAIFTIDELATRMKEQDTFSISRTTLFNTLEMLTDAHLVIKHTMTRAAHYECNIYSGPRIYLVCRDCGIIKKQENLPLKRYMATLKTRSFAVEQPVLYIYGLCRKCTMAQKKKLKKQQIRR